MADDVPPPFKPPVVVRHGGRRYTVDYVAEAGSLLYLWPKRTRRLKACQQALAAAVRALEEKSEGSVAEARAAFVAAARKVGVLEPG